ncbi:MAPEG family protein [Nocardia higoensis]|uniref:MAPEG family protein n=1 Tax=Nocardia higoensis TaxID=228599 RepID=UPI0002E969B4|nr:MAPEG family protein [Nocardia higoensis]
MATAHHPTVDIAGSAWPVYKLEAVVAGLAIALVLGLMTGSAQVAVLAAAAVASVRAAYAVASIRFSPPIRH